MPKGTKVEEVYDALRREGMSEERAAKISQAQTGLSLATGKPPKGTENMNHFENGRKRANAHLENATRGIVQRGSSYNAYERASDEGEEAKRADKPKTANPYTGKDMNKANGWLAG